MLIDLHSMEVIRPQQETTRLKTRFKPTVAKKSYCPVCSNIFSPNLLDFLLRLATQLMLSTRAMSWVNEQSTSLDVYGDNQVALLPCNDLSDQKH